MRIDEWAAKNIVLGREGPLNFSLTPYLRQPLRDYTDPEVEEITECFSTQTGKTTSLIVPPMYYVSEDPWPIMFVMPREDDAVSINVERIQPIIRSSPVLAALLTGEKKDMTREAIRLNGTQLTFSWATSPASLSSRPVAILMQDEMDKWPPWSGKEADPCELSRERTRRFQNRKIGKSSTPTYEQNYIWRELQNSTNQKYNVPCPHCGKFQELVFGDRDTSSAGIKWPESAGPNEIIDRRLAFYRCRSCNGEIRDHHKLRMLADGIWVPKGMEIRSGHLHGRKPYRRLQGYHMWAAYSPFLTFSEIAAKFLQSTNKAQSLMNFTNSWLALPWKESLDTFTDKTITTRQKDYDRGEVPADVEVITAGVDVQLDHFWFTIRGWGTRERSWLIRSGTVFSWAEVKKILAAPYKTAAGRVHKVQRALIDSAYRTDETYKFCRAMHPVTLPSKGAEGMAITKPVQLSRPRAGVLLVRFAANYWKDKLARYIKTEDGETGEWSVHRNIDLAYRQHMISERRVFKRQGTRRIPTWEPVREHEPNHLWDTEVLNTVAADTLGVEFLEERLKSEREASQQQMQAQPQQEEDRDDDWLEQEKGWLEGSSGWLNE